LEIIFWVCRYSLWAK